MERQDKNRDCCIWSKTKYFFNYDSIKLLIGIVMILIESVSAMVSDFAILSQFKKHTVYKIVA